MTEVNEHAHGYAIYHLVCPSQNTFLSSSLEGNNMSLLTEATEDIGRLLSSHGRAFRGI